MKTLQLVPAMEQGGVERGVVEMNRVIVGAGWENVVVAAGGRLLEQVEKDGGRTILCEVKSKNPLTFFSRAARLRRILVAERPDVVCAHSRVPAWLFKWANRGLGIPWITFAHGANSVSAYSKVMTAGDLTVTPSRYIADYLKAAYGIAEEKLRVIPRAIDRDRFDTAKLDQAFIEEKRREWSTVGFRVVMGVGRITQLKGYDRLILAMEHLPGHKLVIVGEAEELRKDVEEDLRALVKRMGIGDRVVFAGNQQKIAECLTLADVVVSSNIEKPEAFGRSMAEALAMGRPVVARAFGGALDVVRNGVDGLLVDAPAQGCCGGCRCGGRATDWPRIFAAAIGKTSQMRFGDLRASAMDRFSFEKMAVASLAVYRELVAQKEDSK